MPTPLIRALSIVVYVDACVWIVGVLPTLYYALQQRDLPTLGPIRLLSGPFEALGIEALIVAGLAYVIVSGLKILAASWIGNGRLDGALLEAILLGLSAIFWYGFALPLGPLLGVVQAVLLVMTWSSLH